MGENSNIEWCHHTYNAWIGCTKISPACDHCYAAEWDKRYHGGQHWGAGVERKRTSIQTRNAPYRWARKLRTPQYLPLSLERPRVFCCSLADVFDNEVPAEWRDELWQVIRDTPELDWLLLTKRIGNVRSMLPEDWGEGWPHVWLGITVVTQAEADRDIPKLLEIPAAVRWLSMEPLLEAADVESYLSPLDDVAGIEHGYEPYHVPALDWIVAGGESGPGARPMHPDWARGLRDQCAAAGVPFLFKQWGDYLPVGQILPGYGKVHGATAVKPGRMKLHYGGTPKRAPKHAFSEHGVEFASAADDRLTFRVGKKAAGRLLDGVTHDEVPQS